MSDPDTFSKENVIPVLCGTAGILAGMPLGVIGGAGGALAGYGIGLGIVRIVNNPNPNTESGDS